MTLGNRPAGVCVVVAFHKPVMGLATRQIHSLKQQEGVIVQGVAVLDGAGTAGNDALRAALQQAGFDLVIRTEAAGVRAAFAAGLRHAVDRHGQTSDYFAYCDQDDVWHADKLKLSAQHLAATGAALVYCDAIVTDEAGDELSPSLHRYEARQAPESLLDVILLNAASGMTMLFTAETARLALRLLAAYEGGLLHDHVTAAAAASIGKTVFLDVPLVDYVQHDRNSLGAKKHRPAWRKRSIGASHLRRYRDTSAALFAERRKLCLTLDREGRLPPALAAMFNVGKRASLPVMLLHYDLAILRLLFRRQFRRAMLCLRMCDSAVRERWGGKSRG